MYVLLESEFRMNPPKGRDFYGAVTVSERGQIVIPAKARRDFGIEIGDKLLVLGDLERGLALMKASMLLELMPDLFTILQAAGNAQSTDDEEV